MITSLSLNYDLSDASIGYVIGNHTKVKSGDKIPLYIPKLMSSIPQGKEKEIQIVPVDSPSYIFANAPSCMPTSKTKLRTLNYILATAEGNSNYSDGLKNGEKVYVFYANDSLRQVYFNTNIRDISTNESTTENENKITPRLNLDVLKKDDETLLVNPNNYYEDSNNLTLGIEYKEK